MRETSHLFTDLQPLPGGLRRLQITLDAAPRHTPAAGVHATAAVFGLALLAAVWILPGAFARHQQTTRLSAALYAAIAPSDKRILVTAGAAIELPSKDSSVRLYLLQSLPANP